MHREQDDLQSKMEDFVVAMRQRDVDAFEISATLETGFSVVARMGAVEQVEHRREICFSLSIYKNGRSASVSVSDPNPVALRYTLDKACSIVDYTEKDEYGGIPEPALLAYDYPDLALEHKWDISVDQAADCAVTADHAARHLDPRITQTEEATVTTRYYEHFLANSHNFFGHYSGTLHSIDVSVVAEDGESMERNGDCSYAHDPVELWSPERIAASAVRRAVDHLHARKISTRTCPVIFEARVAKSLLGHCVSALSGGNVYRGTSFLVDRLGEKIFPSFLDIYQRPHVLSGYGSMPFDQEGVKTRDIHYVEAGALRSYILDHYAAKKMGLTTTGNAGGVFNLSLTHGDQDLAALCRQMDRGLLVTELMGQGVNVMTGQYSRGAAGFWVEKGTVQYPVHEITIAGMLQDMFLQIVSVGNDVRWQSNILCGSILVEKMTVSGN